jgi:hypothetical protein
MVNRASSRAAKVRQPGASVVDAFIAEKRAEAAQEVMPFTAQQALGRPGRLRHRTDPLTGPRPHGHLGLRPVQDRHRPEQQPLRGAEAGGSAGRARHHPLAEGSRLVSPDRGIKTMRETGAEMLTKDKETARGGLAVNIGGC